MTYHDGGCTGKESTASDDGGKLGAVLVEKLLGEIGVLHHFIDWGKSQYSRAEEARTLQLVEVAGQFRPQFVVRWIVILPDHAIKAQFFLAVFFFLHELWR